MSMVELLVLVGANHGRACARLGCHCFLRKGPERFLPIYRILQSQAPDVAASPNVRHALIEALRMNHCREDALAELRAMRADGVRPIYETFAGNATRAAGSEHMACGQMLTVVWAKTWINCAPALIGTTVTTDVAPGQDAVDVLEHLHGQAGGRCATIGAALL